MRKGRFGSAFGVEFIYIKLHVSEYVRIEKCVEEYSAKMLVAFASGR